MVLAMLLDMVRWVLRPTDMEEEHPPTQCRTDEGDPPAAPVRVDDDPGASQYGQEDPACNVPTGVSPVYDMVLQMTPVDDLDSLRLDSASDTEHENIGTLGTCGSYWTGADTWTLQNTE